MNNELYKIIKKNRNGKVYIAIIKYIKFINKSNLLILKVKNI